MTFRRVALGLMCVMAFSAPAFSSPAFSSPGSSTPPPGAPASQRSDAAARLAAAEQERQTQDAQAASAKSDLAASEAQAARLADQLAAEAALLRGTDAAIVSAQQGLATASRAQRDAEAALAKRQAEFSALIPVMLRLQRYPAESVLAVPAPPARALEGLLVTRALATTLAQQAQALAAEQEHAAQLRAATAAEAARLDAERRTQAAGQAALDQAMTAAQGRIGQAEAAGRAAASSIAAAAAQAQTLRQAIAAMDAAQARAEARAAREAARAERQHHPAEAAAARARQAALTRPAAQPAGPVSRLVQPVAGRILRAYGAAAEDGPATGITYEAAPQAFVASPCAGRVAFAAPFRSYGQLLIVECSGGIDVVLAGLGRIDAASGHPTRPGEPLGRMPASPAAPSLYLEIRMRGQPVDPQPFLNAKL